MCSASKDVKFDEKLCFDLLALAHEYDIPALSDSLIRFLLPGLAPRRKVCIGATRTHAPATEACGAVLMVAASLRMATLMLAVRERAVTRCSCICGGLRSTDTSSTRACSFFCAGCVRQCDASKYAPCSK